MRVYSGFARRLFFATLLSLLGSGCDDTYAWPRVPFDSAAWKSTKQGERYRFARNIVDRKMLIGLTNSQVDQLLGNPTTPLHQTQSIPGVGDDPPTFYYEDFILTEWTADGGHVLDVRFTENKIVYRALIRHVSY